MLEARDICKSYGSGKLVTEVLKGITFEIAKGEFVAIMGPSGSGKSTLLHIMSFLDRPTSGTYRVNKRSIQDLTDKELARVRNKDMGFVFQAFFLLPRTSVLDNVMMPLIYTRGVARGAMRVKAEAALERVGLSQRLSYSSAALSGGEKQRVAIARALVNNPDVIFADEPTGNLDSAASTGIMKIFSRLNKEGHTVVLVTHELDIARHAKRLITMRDGVIETDKKL